MTSWTPCDISYSTAQKGLKCRIWPIGGAVSLLIANAARLIGLLTRALTSNQPPVAGDSGYSNQVLACDLQGEIRRGQRGCPSRPPARVVRGMGGLQIRWTSSARESTSQSCVQKRPERISRAVEDWSVRILRITDGNPQPWHRCHLDAFAVTCAMARLAPGEAFVAQIDYRHFFSFYCS